MEDVLLITTFVGGGVAIALLALSLGSLRAEFASLQRQLQFQKEQLDWLARGTARDSHESVAGAVDSSSELRRPTVQEPAPAPTQRTADSTRYWTCGSCRRLNSEEHQFCVACGQPAHETPERVSKGQPQPKSEKPAQSLLTTPLTLENLGTFEQLIGQRWMTWVGALFIIVAVGAAVKVMLDMGLFSPGWRLALECLLGLLILLLGRYLLKQRFLALGQAILGVGLAVFYVSLYAAYHFHGLMSAPFTLTAVALVTGGGMLIAVRYEAVAIAVIAILGGLITPGMVSQGNDIQHVLFAYVLVLYLGVLAVALLKRWRLLDVIAFAGTALLFMDWTVANYTAAALIPTMAWLCGLFALFMLVPFVYSMRTREPLTIERFISALVNATVMILASWYFLAPDHLAVLGIISLLMSLAYLALSVAFKLRIPADERSHYALLALAILFVTLSVPLLLDFNAMIVTWAVEAAALVWLGHRFDNALVRGAAIPVLLVALLRLFLLRLLAPEQVDMLFFNAQFGTAIAIPLGAALAAWLHHCFAQDAQSFDRSNKIALALGSGLLALVLVNLEISSWYAQLNGADPGWLQYCNLSAQLLVWGIGVGLFMVAGLVWSSAAARTTSKLLMLVAAFAALWAYVGMLSHAHRAIVDNPLFWNLRFSASLFLILVIFALGWLYSVMAERLPESERRMPVYLGVAGGLMLLVLCAGELSFWFAIREGLHHANLQIVSLSWQTLVWAVGAAGFLTAGLLWRSSEARIAALASLAIGAIVGLGSFTAVPGPVTTPADGGLMVFNIRFVSCLALVLAMFGYGLFVRRSRAVCSESDQQLATVAYVAADILLLFLLSAEVYKFYHALDLPRLEAVNLANVAQSIVWGAYSLVFVVAGFVLRKSAMRMWAMALLGLTAVKLVLFDLNHMPPLSRLISLIAVGLLMLVIAFIYHRAEQLIAVKRNPEHSGPTPQAPTGI